MVTLSERTNQILDAWQGDSCPSCGRHMRAYHWDEEGIVWSWCDHCDKERWTAFEPRPASFDPEPDAVDDPPF